MLTPDGLATIKVCHGRHFQFSVRPAHLPRFSGRDSYKINTYKYRRSPLTAVIHVYFCALSIRVKDTSVPFIKNHSLNLIYCFSCRYNQKMEAGSF